MFLELLKECRDIDRAAGLLLFHPDRYCDLRRSHEDICALALVNMVQGRFVDRSQTSTPRKIASDTKLEFFPLLSILVKG